MVPLGKCYFGDSCVQDVENITLVIRVCRWFFEREEKLYCHTLYFSLRIVKSLQLCGRRQFAKPCKYCLVCDFYFFFWRIFFLYFCISQVWEFRTYSHHQIDVLHQKQEARLKNKISNIWTTDSNSGKKSMKRFI